MARTLEVNVDDQIEKEMSRYPDIDWDEVIRCAIVMCLRNRGIREMYTAPIDRALSQEK